MSMNRFEFLAAVLLGAGVLLVPGCASTNPGRTAAGEEVYEPHVVRVGEIVYVREVEMPLGTPDAVRRGSGQSRAAMNRSRVDVMGMRVDARIRNLQSQRRVGSGRPSEPSTDVVTVPGVEISVELANGEVVVVMQPVGEETFEIGDLVHVLLRDDGGAVVLQ